MKRMGWIGWVLAGLLILEHTGTGLTAPAGTDPLEGHVLERSDGNLYVYHTTDSSSQLRWPALAMQLSM